MHHIPKNEGGRLHNCSQNISVYVDVWVGVGLKKIIAKSSQMQTSQTEQGKQRNTER